MPLYKGNRDQTLRKNQTLFFSLHCNAMRTNADGHGMDIVFDGHHYHCRDTPDSFPEMSSEITIVLCFKKGKAQE